MITLAIIYFSCSFIGMAICYRFTKPVKSREEILESYRNNQQVLNAINALGKAAIKSAQALNKFSESLRKFKI